VAFNLLHLPTKQARRIHRSFDFLRPGGFSSRKRRALGGDFPRVPAVLALLQLFGKSPLISTL